MQSGVRFLACCLLLLAVLGILSGSQSLRDLDRFAIRHHGVLTEAVQADLHQPALQLIAPVQRALQGRQIHIPGAQQHATRLQLSYKDT